MRIISGLYKNKKILLPTDKLTRPLKDMVKESVFNIIEHSNLIKNNILDSTVLDLYSGAGSFGLECLSRGASKVYFCENYSPVFKILKKNLINLDCLGRSELFNMSVTDFINQFDNSKIKYDFIFLDPPYKEEKINILFELIIKKKILDKNGILILHRSKKTKDIFPVKFKILSQRVYGLSKIYFGKF